MKTDFIGRIIDEALTDALDNGYCFTQDQLDDAIINILNEI